MEKKEGIKERSFSFALRIIKLCRYIEKDRTNRIIANQLLRSGTSIGANIEEAYACQSKPSFDGLFNEPSHKEKMKMTNSWRSTQLLEEVLAKVP